MPAERRVRFTEEFFERLETLLPEERGADGRPSITDFLAFEIPTFRDRLALNAEGATVATAVPDVRALVAAGVLVPALVVYLMIHEDEVEAFGIAFDLETPLDDGREP